MLRMENTEVIGWEAAIRGMRNPLNSWGKSDSHECHYTGCPMYDNGHEPAHKCNDGEYGFCIGKNDLALMKRLREAGSDHRKYMRMITVYVDCTSSLYWWKEYDTYKVGTVANSCSTMHKIAAKNFELDDFSHEHLTDISKNCIEVVTNAMNYYREEYNKTKSKEAWYQMIQLLPSSYNQRRTLMLNYEVLSNIYHARKNHKLDEWHEFCRWIESLPYSELITGV